MEHPDYPMYREEVMSALDYNDIDPPIRELIRGFNSLPHCFTLQCCFGHFIHRPGQDIHNLDRLPSGTDSRIQYRIAYMAFCLENSLYGRVLYESLKRVPQLDPPYIQFGSADWFWNQWPNSWVLQVEPHREREKDQTVVGYEEALHIEKVRDLFFVRVGEVLARQKIGWRPDQ